MDLTLYHSTESTCSQKVRLVLAEKGLRWKEVLLNLRRGDQFAADYLRLNPKAVVPTLVHGDGVICESSIINEYLDRAFAQPPLKPPDPYPEARMRLFIKRIDDDVHPAIGILSFAIALRHQMREMKTPEEIERHFNSVADPMRRERQRDAYTLGLNSPAARQAVVTLRKTCQTMSAALAGQAWLHGGRYSLADVAAVPYMVRMRALGLAELWGSDGAIAHWIERIAERDACRRIEDPWGTASFARMLESHAAGARADLRALFDALEHAPA